MQKKMRTVRSSVVLLIFFSFLQACTEPFIPDTSEEDQQFVVEGFVEHGEDALPPYVIITKSIPFISKVTPETLQSLFVGNAVVTIFDGDKTVALQKLCLNDPNLPMELREAVAEFFGITPGPNTPNICVYVDVFQQVTVEIGRQYDLKVQIDEVVITGSTTIPRHIPLYNFRWDDPPGEPSDTLARLWVTADDLPGRDYYRYLTGSPDEGLIAPFQSVTDDAFFDGKSFEFPLNKAEAEPNFDAESFGLYFRGDSVLIKWLNLDKAHFDFWNTRDYSESSAGPFSSYTRIKGNLEGALGIFGGYSSSTYRLYCPPK